MRRGGGEEEADGDEEGGGGVGIALRGRGSEGQRDKAFPIIH